MGTPCVQWLQANCSKDEPEKGNLLSRSTQASEPRKSAVTSDTLSDPLDQLQDDTTQDLDMDQNLDDDCAVCQNPAYSEDGETDTPPVLCSESLAVEATTTTGDHLEDVSSYDTVANEGSDGAGTESFQEDGKTSATQNSVQLASDMEPKYEDNTTCNLEQISHEGKTTASPEPCETTTAVLSKPGKHASKELTIAEKAEGEVATSQPFDSNIESESKSTGSNSTPDSNSFDSTDETSKFSTTKAVSGHLSHFPVPEIVTDPAKHPPDQSGGTDETSKFNTALLFSENVQQLHTLATDTESAALLTPANEAASVDVLCTAGTDHMSYSALAAAIDPQGLLTTNVDSASAEDCDQFGSSGMTLDQQSVSTSDTGSVSSSDLRSDEETEPVSAVKTGSAQDSDQILNSGMTSNAQNVSTTATDFAQPFSSEVTTSTTTDEKLLPGSDHLPSSLTSETSRTSTGKRNPSDKTTCDGCSSETASSSQRFSTETESMTFQESEPFFSLDTTPDAQRDSVSDTGFASAESSDHLCSSDIVSHSNRPSSSETSGSVEALGDSVDSELTSDTDSVFGETAEYSSGNIFDSCRSMFRIGSDSDVSIQSAACAATASVRPIGSERAQTLQKETQSPPSSSYTETWNASLDTTRSNSSLFATQGDQAMPSMTTQAAQQTGENDAISPEYLMFRGMTFWAGPPPSAAVFDTPSPTSPSTRSSGRFSWGGWTNGLSEDNVQNYDRATSHNVMNAEDSVSHGSSGQSTVFEFPDLSQYLTSSWLDSLAGYNTGDDNKTGQNTASSSLPRTSRLFSYRSTSSSGAESLQSCVFEEDAILRRSSTMPELSSFQAGEETIEFPSGASPRSTDKGDAACLGQHANTMFDLHGSEDDDPEKTIVSPPEVDDHVLQTSIKDSMDDDDDFEVSRPVRHEEDEVQSMSECSPFLQNLGEPESKFQIGVTVMPDYRTKSKFGTRPSVDSGVGSVSDFHYLTLDHDFENTNSKGASELEYNQSRWNDSLICLFHQKQHLCLYCADCCQLICVRCFAESHMDCTRVLTPNLACRDVRWQLLKVQSRAWSQMSEFEKQVERLKPVVEEIPERTKKAKEQLDEQFQQIMRQLETKHRDLMAEVESKCSANEDQFKGLLWNAERSLLLLSYVTKFTEVLRKRDSAMELLTTFDIRLNRMLNKILQESQDNLEPKDERDLDMNDLCLKDCQLTAIQVALDCLGLGSSSKSSDKSFESSRKSGSAETTGFDFSEQSHPSVQGESLSNTSTENQSLIQPSPDSRGPDSSNLISSSRNSSAAESDDLMREILSYMNRFPPPPFNPNQHGKHAAPDFSEDLEDDVFHAESEDGQLQGYGSSQHAHLLRSTAESVCRAALSEDEIENTEHKQMKGTSKAQGRAALPASAGRAALTRASADQPAHYGVEFSSTAVNTGTSLDNRYHPNTQPRLSSSSTKTSAKPVEYSVHQRLRPDFPQDQQRPLITDMLITETGRLVLLDAANQCLKRVDPRQPSFLPRRLAVQQPICLSSAGWERVLVSRVGRVLSVYGVGGQHVRLVASRTTRHQYHSLVRASDSLVAGSSPETRSVDLLDLSGRLLRSIMPVDFVRGPERVGVTSSGQLLAVHQPLIPPTAIVCFDMVGSVVWQRALHVRDRYVTLCKLIGGADGRVYYAVRGESTVYRFSPEEENSEISPVLTHAQGVQLPTTLAVDDDGRVIITRSDLPNLTAPASLTSEVDFYFPLGESRFHK